MPYRILKSYKPLGLCFVLAVASPISFAQSGTITGHVITAGGSTPQEPKVILIDKQNDGIVREPESINDVTGEFRFRNVQEGSYTVVACAGMNYTPSKLEIQMTEGQTRSAELTLTVPTQRTSFQGKGLSGNIKVSALAYKCEVTSVKTDNHGRFRFADLPVPPGRYTVQTRSSSGTLLESNAILVSAGAKTEVTLSVEGNKGLETGLIAEIALPRCDRRQQQETDLSGTYTGKVNYPDAGLTGEATLTITGNDFSLTSGSEMQSGRITAVTTCGYTGVTMMFGDLTPPAPSPNPPPFLPAVSLHVRKVGDRVRLTTVPGETRSFSFGSSGTAKAVRKHRQPG